MKRSILLLAITLSIVSCLWAQAPQQINYQAVVRNAAGQTVTAGTPVKLRFTIHNASATGTAVYTETSNSLSANQFGLVTTAIGLNANLGNVNWGNGSKWLQVEVDVNNTGTFTDMGTTQLNAVPYALYAANSPAGATGPTGPAGAQGATGPQGSQGLAGPTGAGITGPTGPQGVGGGATGPTGPAGANGSNGSNGAAGATGPAGANGATGPQGPAGAQGVAGVTGPSGPGGGATGPSGPTGPTGSGGGATGPSGINGTNGANGNTGPTGPAGANGINGTNGAAGATGPAGTNGTNGAQGPTGLQGHTGSTGPTGAGGGATGPSGPTGPTGVGGGATGPTGANGTNGTNGANGVTGPTGPQGIAGANGTNGTNGAAGATGPAGTNGTNGAAGAQGPTGLQGHTGSTGPTGAGGGATGPSGPTGPTGAGGGATGPTGANGTNGTNGTNGATGPTGPQGIAGANGTNGTNGAAGPTGPQGLVGANGAGGAAGPTGPQGLAGTNGTAGVAGPTGPAGATGPQGIAGANGAAGAAGPTGPAGTNGTNGNNGTNGSNGTTGPTGPAGTNGTAGPTGPTGAGGVSGTINYVSKFTSATAVGNSIMFDNGTTVGVNTTTPNSMARLEVVGSGFLGANVPYQASIMATGSSNQPSASGIYGEGGWRGVYGRNLGTSGATDQSGVLGRAEGSTYTHQYGVKGEAAGTGATNYGVHGTANGGTVANYGLYGETTTASGTGYGSYGKATGATTYNYGNYGQASGASSYNYASYGNATGSANANYGFYGDASGGSNNFGTYAKATGASTGNYGLYGFASGSNTVNYGVYGLASAAAGAAGRFDAAGGAYGLLVTGGSAGIGTTNPAARLHVVNANSDSILLLENPTALNNGVESGMWFRTGNLFTGGIQTTGTGPYTARMSFYTYSANARVSMHESMTILDNSNIGIGTINPAAMLELEARPSLGGIPVLMVEDTSNANSSAHTTYLHSKYGIGNLMTLYQESSGNAIYAAKIRATSSQPTVLIEGTLSGTTPALQVTSYNGYSAQFGGKVRIADGTAALGAVLMSDANGVAHWDTTVNPKIGFFASNITLPPGSGYVQGGYNLVYTTIGFNDGNGYNSSTGIFTAPQAGVYHFDCNILIRTTISTTCDLMIYVNGSFINRLERMATDANERSMVLGFDIKLNAGDNLNTNFYYGNVTGSVSANQGYSFFSGHKVY